MHVYICKDSRTQVIGAVYLACWHLLKTSVRKINSKINSISAVMDEF